ncbi:MAG: DUF2156 domain-containing protein [Bacteroides graminisolvens]|jgi:Uncharacterized conserved protein|uniref:Phosphatidylglycerol lysyltransferase C-terminal domain-containing protein n=1 Tax=Bacteroides graminisolvens DSM 19988 = JCM 15093 TaxID=1121097 RepID=A0A069CYC0_9BACE|nr:DUF2156 domain-containing protein [Bacteroides graminisolvens]MBP6140283.1 DUF2156 domain-containing protein [Bacteroides sp.]MBP7292766.1 DUF2156 domain-containing protein [Bacteroides sp.]MBP9720769.1 DUF2156 domain-containing protein [Bacteroides sp.]MCD8474596.1 DUF2156 domain-containing protein [Bacteroides graminisolvens]MCD8556260.1 DUF2156 domain-containing protein [Bacteroides graminisolvens]
MIEFKDITVEDKDTITSFTMNSCRRNCDLSFSNLCSWRFMYNTKFAVIDNFLVFKFWLHGRVSYMMPVGQGDPEKELIEKLIEDSQLEGEPLRLMGVCQGMKKRLNDILPGKFEFTTNRDYSDYIYLRSDLATLTGKKFQSKRNHINRFKKEYTYKYVPITPDRVQECLYLEAEWCKANDCDKQDGTGNERQAIVFALEHFEELGLSGGILYANDKIVAFTFGMPINKETFGVHVEKADTTVDGAYAMINFEFANHIPETFTYINREEDLGIEGLRKAKLSYQPETILEKFVAHYKG